ncbi:MAG: hypothetical protein LBP29_08175 [Treponema sp.]|jgi:hypothetical protein|nr:hypothetical protein [Treponema sp.]
MPFKTGKTGIVDVRLTTTSGKVIHVELQVKKELHKALSRVPGSPGLK